MSNPVPQVIPFQFNPDTISRSVQGQGGGGDKGGSQMETFRLRGPPIETINLDIELDATDKLEHPDQNKETVKTGLLAEESCLELLLYPKSQDMLSADKATSSGNLEIFPAESLFTLFVWGSKKVLPVRITKLEFTEEAFDAILNPIRAKISLGLRVLSYSDLPMDHPGYSLFFAHQIAKENLAAGNISNDLSTINATRESLFR